MNLVYMDDSGTDEGNPFALYGALVIDERRFHRIEIVHDVSVETLIPPERIGDFEEFHAFDLYKGRGVFEGIDEHERFEAIRFMLRRVQQEGLTYVYAAVNKKALQNYPLLGSANAADVAFRQCLLGVEDWCRSLWPKERGRVVEVADANTCFYVLDETKDVQLKKLLRSSYRSLRKKRPLSGPDDQLALNRLWHAHDDLYFGDSRDSVGIQMADLCNYFVLRHLKGIPDTEGFFELYRSSVRCSTAEPEWSQYKTLFRSHVDCAPSSGAVPSASVPTGLVEGQP